MRFVVPLVILTALVLAAAPPAAAQVESREGITLQNQIYQLRQELRTLQDQTARGGNIQPRPVAPQPPPAQYGGNDLLAQLLTRVDALEEQVRQLRGRIDELQNQQQQMGQDLNKKIDDLAFQVNTPGAQPRQPDQTRPPDQPNQAAQPRPGGQSAPPVSGPPSTSPPVSPTRPTGPVNRTPELALQEGNAALNRHDYSAAEAAAREVLSNRTSPRAYDAKLLLAQALQGERQFPQAAVTFDDVYNGSRKGSHAQDALIGIATSLAAIKEWKASCDTLNRLRTEFPQPRPEIRQAAAVVSQKSSCH